MIEREEREWGVRLILRPLQTNRALLIQAEISNPAPRKNPQIRFVFSGASVTKPLCLADALTWREAFDAMIAEAKGVAEELKVKRRKATKGKQSPPKKTRRRAKRG